MSEKTYRTGFDRIMDCAAGRRILTQTRTQPPRITAATDGAIDWTNPHQPTDEYLDSWTPPPAPCAVCGEPTCTGWIDCTCPGAENGGHQTHECTSCTSIVYTTRHTEPTT